MQGPSLTISDMKNSSFVGGAETGDLCRLEAQPWTVSLDPNTPKTWSLTACNLKLDVNYLLYVYVENTREADGSHD